MTSEEKSAWILILVAVVTFAIYIAVLLGRIANEPISTVDYVTPLLWSIGASIVAAIVLNIVAGMLSPKDAGKKDQRDREIDRFGEHVGQSFLVIGALAAMVMAMLELDYFWIANALYLGFALSAVLGSIAKIFAYRGAFQQW
jgi:cell division protein FtsW (lipid II flippase)